MTRWRKTAFVLACAIVLAGALFIVACGGSAEEPTSSPSSGASEPTGGGTKELVVGTVMPLSGPLSTVGLAWNRGFELYFEKINEEGGLKIGDTTYTFKLIEEDGKGAAESAGAAARKLITEDGATIIYGEIMDGATAAIYDVAAQNKVLHVIPSVNVPGTPGDVGPGKDYLVRPNGGFDDCNTADLAFLKEHYPNVKTIGVSQPDLGTDGMVADFKEAAEAAGYQVIVEKWAWGVTDFVPTYTKLLSKKPDAVMILVSGQSADQLKACRQLGFKGPVFANSPLGPEIHVRIAGPDACTDFFCNGLDPEDPPPVMAEVMKRWDEKFGDEWVSDAVQAWDEAWIITQAMQKAGSVVPEDILAALDASTNDGDLENTSGPVKMGGADRFGVNRVLIRRVPITSIDHGKMTFEGFFESSYK